MPLIGALGVSIHCIVLALSHPTEHSIRGRKTTNILRWQEMLMVLSKQFAGGLLCKLP